MTRQRFLIEGQVQGVGYRRFAQRAAERLGVVGWVRNLPDGRVEVKAVGPDLAVAEMASWLAEGPAGANVTKVETFLIVDEIEQVSAFRVVS